LVRKCEEVAGRRRGGESGGDTRAAKQRLRSGPGKGRSLSRGAERHAKKKKKKRRVLRPGSRFMLGRDGKVLKGKREFTNSCEKYALGGEKKENVCGKHPADEGKFSF